MDTEAPQEFWQIKDDDTPHMRHCKNIMAILIQANFWLVGGIIRDMLIGKEPRDIDVIVPRLQIERTTDTIPPGSGKLVANGDEVAVTKETTICRRLRTDNCLDELLEILGKEYAITKRRGNGDEYPMEHRDVQMHNPRDFFQGKCNVLTYQLVSNSTEFDANRRLVHGESDFRINIDFVSAKLYRRFLDADVNGMILRPRNALDGDMQPVLTAHIKAPPIAVLQQHCQERLFMFLLPRESRDSYANTQAGEYYWFKSLVKRDWRLAKFLNRAWMPVAFNSTNQYLRDFRQSESVADWYKQRLTALHKHVVTTLNPAKPVGRDYLLQVRQEDICHLCSQCMSEEFVYNLYCHCRTRAMQPQAHISCVLATIRAGVEKYEMTCPTCHHNIFDELQH